MSSRFVMYDTDGSQQILELAGREEWALSHLLAVKDGQFAGTDILRSKVERLGAMEMAA
jgi:hypothetical protein